MDRLIRLYGTILFQGRLQRCSQCRQICNCLQDGHASVSNKLVNFSSNLLLSLKTQDYPVKYSTAFLRFLADDAPHAFYESPTLGAYTETARNRFLANKVPTGECVCLVDLRLLDAVKQRRVASWTCCALGCSFPVLAFTCESVGSAHGQDRH
jgi:hypothetical protein